MLSPGREGQGIPNLRTSRYVKGGKVTLRAKSHPTIVLPPDDLLYLAQGLCSALHLSNCLPQLLHFPFPPVIRVEVGSMQCFKKKHLQGPSRVPQGGMIYLGENRRQPNQRNASPGFPNVPSLSVPGKSGPEIRPMSTDSAPCQG